MKITNNKSKKMNFKAVTRKTEKFAKNAIELSGLIIDNVNDYIYKQDENKSVAALEVKELEVQDLELNEIILAEPKELTLGQFPKLPNSLEENLSRLCLNINFCGDQFRKIMITSSVPDEGKSFVTMNVWRMLAESGQRTVLIDADMRKSMLRSRYHMMSGEADTELYGLANYLSGQNEMDEVIYATNVEGGYIVPTIHSIVNPTLLLQNARFSELITYLSKHYDRILIDTPPLNSVVDGAQIAPLCDGGLLVVRGGTTPRSMISASLRQLERAECPLMGVVLNRMDKKNVPYYKYTKKGYGNETTK